jgi:multiple sugar transport system permease protein
VTKRARSLTFTIVAFAGAAIYLFPIYWMLISGFKSSAEIFVNPPTFFPRDPSLEAFHSVIVQENIARYLRNSVVIALPVTLLTLALGSIGAYAMSRIRSRLVDVALVIVLLLQVFPEALIATPIFIIFKAMGLLNSFVAVILATTSKTLAFALVILRPLFLQVPHELEEASFVDGATPFQAFWRIVLPMMRAPLLVVGAICFAQAYGQFVYPITLLTQQELQPGSVGIYAFIGAELSDWHRVMAFASIYVLPILALFLLLQRNIVAGLTAGALK